jgi:23S rRNA pseudoU1915 N3-methylase RlmH
MSKDRLAAFAEKVKATGIAQKTTERQKKLEEVKAHKSDWIAAIENGHTRKALLEGINAAGYKITSRDFADIVGRQKHTGKRKRKAKKNRDVRIDAPDCRAAT